MKKLLSLALALILSIGLATPAGAFFDMGKVGVRNTISAGHYYSAAVGPSGTLMLNYSGTPFSDFSKKLFPSVSVRHMMLSLQMTTLCGSRE